MASGVTASAASGTGWTCSLLSLNKVVSCVFSGALPAPGGSFPPITITVATTLGSGNISSSATVTSPDGLSASATASANVAAPPPPVLAVQSSGPSLIYAGTSFPIAISPSISSGAGSHSPVVTAVLAAGETFPASSITQSGYICGRSTTTVANDTLTCTSTVTLPVGVGLLGAIVATVNVALVATGAPAASVKLTDPSDNATPAVSGTAPTIVPIPLLAVAAGVTPSGPTFGSSVQVTVQPSLTGLGGPALSAPTVAIAAPVGATFPSAPTPSGYSCMLTSSTLVTCICQGSLLIAPGTSLTPIAANATIGAIGSLQFVAKFSDAGDGATPALAPGTVVAVQASQAITASTAPSNVTVGSPTDTPSGTGGLSGNPVVITLDLLSTGCTLTSGVVAFIAPGTCIVDFNQAGNANYTAAPQVQQAMLIEAKPLIGEGYRLPASDGGVFAFGADSFLGSLVSRGVQPTASISGMAATRDGNGYWLVGQDGTIYTFGDAKFFGTPASFHIPLNAPIQGMVATPDGNGYWLVASDGGVFAFGGAGFKGNTYTTGIESQLTKPMVGMAATPDGNGYWLGAADGAVFAYGGAQFLGNTYTIGIENQLSGPMTGLTEAP